ncbi:MAG: branched-chain amino acid ABC transporter permease [Candidatus Aminicenantes bacterium]
MINYFLHILVMINIYLILALSLNVFMGYTGLISLTHAAFFGIGAYTTALLMIHLKLNFFLCLLLGMVLTFIIAYLIGKISLIFKEELFVLVTLGFQMIVYAILYNWTNVTRGAYGIIGIPKPSLLGFEFSGLWSFFILSGIIAAVMFIYFKLLDKSAFCLYLKGIRDNELAFISSGKSPAYYKTLAFVISGGAAGISGALYAPYINYISPDSFNLDVSIFILCIVMVGGAGNLRGPLIGTIFMVIAPEALKYLGLPDAAADNMRQIIYGLLLVLLMRYRPQGLLGEYKFE